MNLARSKIRTEMQQVRGALRSLDRSLGRLVSLNGAEAPGTRRRPRLSAKARASLVLQGRYMGFIRQLKPRQKAQVRKLKEAKGVRAAIVEARHLAAQE